MMDPHQERRNRLHQLTKYKQIGSDAGEMTIASSVPNSVASSTREDRSMEGFLIGA
jgi:hypothetical protein